MQRRDYPEVPDDFGHWLAGFIDGEGCFSITHNGKKASRTSLRCTFRIALRSDDTALLDECQERTGLGTVYQQAGRGSDNPSAMWHVAHRRDALRLVGLLAVYPLRSKKRRDFAVWAEAVRLRGAAGYRGRHDAAKTAQLKRLRHTLMEGRRWRDHGSDLLVPEPVEANAIASGDDMALF